MIKDVRVGAYQVKALYAGLSLVWQRGVDPNTLFVNNRQGVWYDLSDLSTLFQDAAMTIPVTAHGDPVGGVKDKSGNGNHATQTVSAKRPTYRTDGVYHWLSFDGVDDYLLIKSTVNMNAGDMFWGVRCNSYGTKALLSNSLGGYIATYFDGLLGINKSATYGLIDTPSNIALKNKIAIRILKSKGYLTATKYNDAQSYTNSEQGGNTLSADLIIGAFSSSSVIPSNMDLYNLVMFESELTDGSAGLMQYVADKTGSY